MKNEKVDPLKGLKDAANAGTEVTIEKFETGTLAGDIRDVILTHFRGIKVPWAMLAEDEQQEKIEAFENLGRDIARRVVYMVAASEMPVVHVTLGKWTVGASVEAKISSAAILDNITKLAEHGQNAAVLVLADPGAYMGERAKAEADPNQRPLPLED
jgi:hypothetical protein